RQHRCRRRGSSAAAGAPRRSLGPVPVVASPRAALSFVAQWLPLYAAPCGTSSRLDRSPPVARNVILVTFAFTCAVIPCQACQDAIARTLGRASGLGVFSGGG